MNKSITHIVRIRLLPIYWCLFLTIFLGKPNETNAQNKSIGINLLGLAATQINIDPALQLSNNWTFHFPIQYSPYSYQKDKTRLRNLTIMPGVRYWFHHTYGPSFFMGMYGIASHFNLGKIAHYKGQYKGYAAGAGVSVGRNFPLSQHWNLETELGGGHLWFNYNQNKQKKWQKKNLFVPTKVALRITYLIY